MKLAEKLTEIKNSKTFGNFKGTAMLKLFGLTKVPLIFMVNPRVKELTPHRCAIVIPLNFVTKNHLGSMYFGTLAIGADCAAGLFAMYKAGLVPGAKFSIVFKDFKANFLKRPEDDVTFTCLDAQKIDEMLREAKASGERVTQQIRIEARTTTELVAEFELGLSLKPLSKKSR